MAYSVDLKRLHGRWLIDSFYPRAAYGSVAATTTKQSDEASAAAPPAEKQAHGTVMWFLILGFFGLVVLTPVVLLGGPMLRARLSRSGR